MKNKIQKIIISSIIMCSIFLFNLSNVDAATLNKDVIDLYGLSDDYTKYLEMPSNFKSEEQIILNDAVGETTYRLKKGSTITVDNTGLVKIKQKVMYCTSSFCASFEMSGATKVVSYESGSNIVEVKNGSQTFEVTVNTYAYEEYNAKNIMETYVKENITNGMTEYQKMEKILELISTTNYSVESSTYVGLFSGNGGDCWASTDAIIYMANLVGITAHARDAKRDLGAGSGHYNVAAILDGKVYVVEGGYNEQAPRNTGISVTFNGFTTGSGNYLFPDDPFIQYDGYEENVSVPAEELITKLGKFAFYYGMHDATHVKTVYIPSTITEIEPGAFSRVPTLTDVTVDENNSNYKSIDGIVYSKDGTLLHSYPSGKTNTSYTIKEGVTELGEYSFSYNNNLTQIQLPESLKIIGTKAFYDNNFTGIVVPENVEEIGDYAFSDASSIESIGSAMNYLVVKNPNAKLGKDLCSSMRPIYGLKGSTAEQYATEKNCLFGEIKENQNTFKDIKNYDITISSVEYQTNNNIPEITIKDGDYTLQENVDYIATYSNNNKVTNYANAMIMGIGDYVGYTSEYYQITKKQIHYTYTNPVVEYNGNIQSPIITTEEDDVTIYYGNNAYSDLSTELREYQEPGTYEFGVRIEGTNYESVYLNDLTFTINPIDFTKATISDISNYPYLGYFVHPTIEVKYNDTLLEEDKDYTYSISNNYRPGTATITIKGKGIYEGTITKNFQILSNDQYKLKINKENLKLNENSTFKLNIYTEPEVIINTSDITWTSLNNNIATVDENGTVKGIAKGTTTIRAKFNGQTIESIIEVIDYLKGDMNKDGNISITDVIKLLRVYLELDNEEADTITIGDMNNSENITITDVIILLRQYLELE